MEAERQSRALAGADAGRADRSRGNGHGVPRFDALAATLPIGVFRAQPDVGNVYVNDRFLAVIGLERDEALGLGWMRVVHPDDRPRVVMQRDRAMRERREFALEHRIVRPDGAIRWVRVRAVPTFDTEGEHDGFAGSMEDVTDRVIAEDMTGRLTAVCELTTDFVVITDPAGRYVFVNRATRDALGLAPDEELGALRPMEFVTSSSRDVLVGETLESIERSSTWSGEVVMRARDGREIPVSQVIVAHRGADGEIEYYSSIARDISHEKDIERDLLAEAMRLGSLVENAADVVTMHRADGTILDISPSVRTVLGWGPEEVLAMEPTFLSHPDDLPALSSARQQVLERGRGAREDVVHRIRHRSGEWRWLRTRFANLLEDPAVGAIIAISHDETERRRVEEALRESEGRFRSLAASSPLGIAYADTEGNVRYVNERWREIYGKAPDGSDSDWDVVHPDDRERVRRDMYDAAGAGRGSSVEYRILRDGELRTVRSYLGPVRDEGGMLVGFVGSVDDVTESRRAQVHNERLAALLEATPDAAVVADPSGRVLFLNRGGRELLGIDSDVDLSGVLLLDLIRLPEWAQTIVHDELLPSVRRDGVWRGEIAVCGAQGREIPVSQVTMAHCGPDGEIEFYSAIARDVTASKEIEARLAHSEQWFRSLVQHAVDLVTVRDADGVVTYASPALRTMLGVDPDEIVGNPEQHMELHPDDVEAMTAARVELRARSGHTVLIQYRARHRDGSWRVLESRMTNLLDDPVVGGIVNNSHDVTERYEAEAALARSESALRAVLQGSPLAIFAVDVTGRAELWNRACEELFGWTSDEVLGNALPFATGTADFSRLRELLFSGRTVRNIEAPLRGRDGEVIDTNLALAPVRDADGAVVTVVGIVSDIGEQKAADVARRASEARFRSLVQHSSDFVVVYDAAGRITYASPSVARFSDHRVGDMVARHEDFVHADDREKLLTVFAEVTESGGSSRPFEVRLLSREQSYHWMEMIVTNLLDDPNVGGIVINAREITERKEAEAALRESEQKFRALVQNGSDIITLLNADGTVRYTSPAGGRVMGYPDGWGVGMEPTAFTHPDDADSLSNVLATALATPGETGPAVFRLRHADGSWRWVEAMATNLLDDPVINGLVITARDVTERIEAADALRRNEERFRALVQNLSDVITVVDDAGQITYTSPAASQLFGFEDGDETWTNPLDRVHPADVAEVIPGFAEQLAAEGETDPVPFRLRDRDGRWRYVEAIAKDMRSDPSVGGIVVTTRDVTARRRAELLVTDHARILEMIASGAALSDTLSAICEVVETHAQDALCSVLLVDESTDRLVHGVAPSLPDGWADTLVGGIPIAEGEGCFGTTAARASRVVCTDIATDPLCARSRDVALSYDLRSCWAVPIVSSDGGHVVGTFAVHYREQREPDPEHLTVVEHAVHLAAIAIDRKAFEDRLAHQAHHDPLTGLPNRALFLEFLVLALARAKRHRSSVGVLFLDLDRFKVVNDSLGHDAGDELLVATGRRLQGVLRPGDTIARFGGDEFTVLCEDLSGPHVRQQAVELAERLLEAIHQPFPLGKEETFLSASIGISLSGGSGADQPDALMRDADAAMFRAKERGKGRWELFDEEMRSSVLARLETENALHRSLERREFTLYFQPVVSLDGGRCVGAEALIRWQHPERGLMLPADFITIAEETGLVVPIGAWVLEEACRQVAEWERETRGDGPFVVSVNVSGRQLAQPDFVAFVANVLDRTGADPARLCLEFTESVLMDEAEETLGTIVALRGLGVHLSIDDFGTGYSSLGYLKRFPVDSVKVDRSFVDGLGTDPEDSAIVTAVVSLGHALGMAVVAEGVETSQQLAELVALGCDQAQGFYFAPPQPPGDLMRLLGPDRRWRPPGIGIVGSGRTTLERGRRRPAS